MVKQNLILFCLQIKTNIVFIFILREDFLDTQTNFNLGNLTALFKH